MCPPAGPTPETISDFWQMIWDVRPAVIVMLTKVNENGRVRDGYGTQVLFSSDFGYPNTLVPMPTRLCLQDVIITAPISYMSAHEVESAGFPTNCMLM